MTTAPRASEVEPLVAGQRGSARGAGDLSAPKPLRERLSSLRIERCAFKLAGRNAFLCGDIDVAVREFLSHYAIVDERCDPRSHDPGVGERIAAVSHSGDPERFIPCQRFKIRDHNPEVGRLTVDLERDVRARPSHAR